MRIRAITALLLAVLLAGQACCLAEYTGADAFYDLSALPVLSEGETARLLLSRSYYSGETVYKGSTTKPLNGACALHCAAVVISNLRGSAVSGQQVAKANNRDIRNDSRWTPYVSWGKVASAFDISVHTEDMAQYGNRLKQRGVKSAERRRQKMARLVELFEEHAAGSGLIVHFNSSGVLNGSGTHRHAVVLMGVVERGGEAVDLLINDSSVAAPGGACVRMSESSLPLSIMGKRKAEQAAAKGENLALLLMDYAVSCRWIADAAE